MSCGSWSQTSHDQPPAATSALPSWLCCLRAGQHCCLAQAGGGLSGTWGYPGRGGDRQGHHRVGVSGGGVHRQNHQASRLGTASVMPSNAQAAERQHRQEHLVLQRPATQQQLQHMRHQLQVLQNEPCSSMGCCTATVVLVNVQGCARATVSPAAWPPCAASNKTHQTCCCCTASHLSAGLLAPCRAERLTLCHPVQAARTSRLAQWWP